MPSTTTKKKKSSVVKRAAAKIADTVKKVAKKIASGGKKKAKKRSGPIGKKNMAPVLPSLDRLREIHPDVRCELDHADAFQLLVATVLSAQTTDVLVNKASPKLFAQFPDAHTLGAVDSKLVEPFVSTLGFFRQKAKSIVGLSKKLVELHNGVVPQRLDDLVKLPGVGRKTANVVLGVMWNTPEGVVVDTHVQRLSQRLGWTRHSDPAKIEPDLMHLIPQDQWAIASHLLIFHGRRICFAQKPNCEGCGLNTVCPSAFKAETVGRKPKRPAWPRPEKSAKTAKTAKTVKTTKKA